MGVPAAGLVRLGQPEMPGIRENFQARHDPGLGNHREEQVVRAKVIVPCVGGELSDDLAAELQAAVLLPFRVLLNQEPLPVGVKLGVDLDHDPADSQHVGRGVQVPWPELSQFPHRKPLSMAVSTSNLASAPGRAW